MRRRHTKWKNLMLLFAMLRNQTVVTEASMRHYAQQRRRPGRATLTDALFVTSDDKLVLAGRQQPSCLQFAAQ